jgi:hypothetical protein
VAWPLKLERFSSKKMPRKGIIFENQYQTHKIMALVELETIIASISKVHLEVVEHSLEDFQPKRIKNWKKTTHRI